MLALSAFILATPLFGFSLTAPATVLGAPPSGTYHLIFQVAEGAAEVGDTGEDEGTAGTDAEAQTDLAPQAAAAAAAEENADPVSDLQVFAAQMRQRQELGTIHRALGIATWASMLATVGLGFIQYYNQYGFFGGVEDTPCVQGGAIFGQEQCWGQPWAHRIAALTTTGLYTATMTLSFLLPDPDHLDEGEGEYASNLRIHKALRWVHMVGMVAQMFLGFAVGQNLFGLDRANDFGAQQALATIHQGIGLVTFGALTGAAAVMIF